MELYAQVGWSWDHTSAGGSCKKEKGTNNVPPGSGTKKNGVEVAQCKDIDGEMYYLFCKMSLAGDLSAHFSNSVGGAFDGRSVTTGCSVASNVYPNAGKCCFLR
jgi:hypothetical protein